MEAKNEALPAPPTGTRGKGPKREEQYRQLWAELESLVRAFADTSENHSKVLDCVLNCKKPGVPEDLSTSSPAKHKLNDELESMDEVEQGWAELDKLNKMTEKEKQELLQGTATFDTPDLSPAKKTKPDDLLMRSGGQTLLSMWNNRLKAIHGKRTQDFDGRSEGTKAKLYIALDENSEDLASDKMNNSAFKNKNMKLTRKASKLVNFSLSAKKGKKFL